MTEHPSAIFFDLDGTILDWQTGMEDSWRAACETHVNGAHTPEQVHDAIRTRRNRFWEDLDRAYRGRMSPQGASREIVESAFLDLGLDAVDGAHRLADDYRARRDAMIAPYTGAIETLDALRSRGVPMALITNGNAQGQRRSVERFGLARYFDCIIIEGEFGCGKPDERVFRHALETTACDATSAWMVGDNLDADIATPHRLGMHTVWVDAAGAGVPPSAAVKPHRVVASIAELI